MNRMHRPPVEGNGTALPEESAAVLAFVAQHYVRAVQCLHEFTVIEGLEASSLAGLVFEQPNGSVLFRYETRREAAARFNHPEVRAAMPPNFCDIVSTALFLSDRVVPIVAVMQNEEWALFFVDARPPFGRRPAPRGVQ